MMKGEEQGEEQGDGMCRVCACAIGMPRDSGRERESREWETVFNFIRRTRTGGYRPAILNLTGYPTIVYANR